MILNVCQAVFVSTHLMRQTCLYPQGSESSWSQKGSEITPCHWEVTLGLQRGSREGFVLPKISAFQRFTCSVLGKHKSFHRITRSAHPTPSESNGRFIAQAPQVQSCTLCTLQWGRKCFIPHFIPHTQSSSSSTE